MAKLTAAIVLVSGVFGAAAVTAQVPDLSGNWILDRASEVEFGEMVFTEAGQIAFDNYDYTKDDPAYDCIGASWTRIWLNPNVLVGITQAQDHVRLQYEWIDVDRRVPLVDPAACGRLDRIRTGNTGPPWTTSRHHDHRPRTS